MRVLEGQNKFDQLAIAETFGLRIPATLVTNDPVAAKNFVEQNGATAIKSVAGYGHQVEHGFYAIYTNIVTKEMLGQFESIRMAPVCLQKYINKEFELRVTIVGERVFGCRIDSQSTQKTQIDWRRRDYATPYSVYTINQELSGRLIAIMKHYGVRFASFDLVVTPDGQIVFLEMNPATQFLWIEKLTGMPITDAIIDEIIAQC
jgi:glutathione synthase/RimK-type ligase-like ATP-grasp enzyme